MKTLKITNLIILLFSLVIVTSCVQDDDFDTPDASILEPDIDPNELTSITAVAGALSQEQDQGEPLDYDDDTTLLTFEGTGDVLEAYVISSDAAGNFFEEIILQDALENPTRGIKLLIDVNPLFTKYEVGRKLYINLDGLTVGISNGVLALGVIDGGRVGKIAPATELSHIQRSATIGDVIPLPLDLDMFTNDKTNLFVQLADVQFNRGEVLGDNPKTFASEDLDEFDGERVLESCTASASVIFSTSTFADFKGLLLPAQRGTMNAILTKNFFGDMFNVSINSPEDITFDNADRCDPAEFIIGEVVDCDDTSITGATTLFEDDFDSYSSSSDLADAGWELVNINGGSYNWGIDEFGSNTFAIANAFNTGQTVDAWLISPPINLDSTTEDVLNFEVQTNFDGGEVLSVYVSSNFVDLETDSNWSLLEDVDIPSGPSGTFGSFEAAGPVNLSCVDGTVRIAFRYTGSDPGITTRYHVDNIVVSGN